MNIDGGLVARPSINAIQEYEILTGSLSAEFGLFTFLAGKELPVSSRNGRAVITVPQLHQYDVITVGWA